MRNLFRGLLLPHIPPFLLSNFQALEATYVATGEKRKGEGETAL